MTKNMEYTLTLQSQEDYRLIKKLLKAFDGASIRPKRKPASHIDQAHSPKIDRRLKAFDKLAGSLSMDMIDTEDPRTKYLLSK